MSQNILSVAEFVRALKSLVVSHRAFQNVALVGEISNFNAHHSGHFYFSLKDKDARVACVMFKSKSSAVLFRPKNGDKVVIMGYVDVFESAGTIQIYVERMNLDGLGDLHIRFEALKKEYFEKGYFEESHKKALPKYPRRIGVITGADSAAYADISRTLKERWPIAEQVDLLAYVQGEKAIDSLVARIIEANTLNLDAIILARGGGSIEDLWAFNEERVVQAVFNSKTVIVSGVGHESDVTLVDYVSDYRAATPTAAVVALTPDIKDVVISLRDYKNRFYVSVRNRIRTLSASYDECISNSYLKDPKRFFDRKQQVLDYQQGRIVAGMKRFDEARDYLSAYSNHLHHLMERRLERELITVNYLQERSTISLNDLLKVKRWNVSLYQDSMIRQERELVRIMKDNLQVISTFESRIMRLGQRHVSLKKSAFNDIIKTLDLLSPLKIMGRGYALVYHGDVLVKSIDDIDVGENLHIKMKDGTVLARVEKRESND